MIEKQIGSIKADRGSQNFWEKKKKTQFWKEQRHIVETPQSIEIDEQNAWVCDVMFFKNKVLNPAFPKLRFSSIKIVFHKNLKYLQTWLVRPKTHAITCTMFSKE